MTILAVWCNQHQEVGSVWNDQMGLVAVLGALPPQAVENLVSVNEHSFLTPVDRPSQDPQSNGPLKVSLKPRQQSFPHGQ